MLKRIALMVNLVAWVPPTRDCRLRGWGHALQCRPLPRHGRLIWR